jgi:HAMP domain-containing protein
VRLTSIRARVAILSSLFAILLVGGITISTYFFVARGSVQQADSASERLALSSRLLLQGAIDDALYEADRRGLSDVETGAYVARTIRRGPPDAIVAGIGGEAVVSLYVWPSAGAASELAWSMSSAAGGGSDSDRAAAADSGDVVSRTIKGRPLMTGIFLSADLGRRITYVPVDVPGIYRSVIDVEYTPSAQERSLDSIRLPMALVAAASLGIALALVNLTNRWTLSLVSELRRTADSVDAAQLDIQLPEDGDNEISELLRSLEKYPKLR